MSRRKRSREKGKRRDLYDQQDKKPISKVGKFNFSNSIRVLYELDGLRALLRHLTKQFREKTQEDNLRNLFLRLKKKKN